MIRSFENFAVVDWSGQNVAKPPGLAVAFASTGIQAPVLLKPRDGWSRQGVLEWLLRLAEAKTNVLVGLDLSPALPFVDRGAYFPDWADSPDDARALWALVDTMAADDLHLAANGFLNDHEVRRHFRHHGDCGDLFEAGRGRLRVCEYGQRDMGLSPQSCFNLVGAAQVGKSSLTGMRVLHRLRGLVPVWPFDPIPKSGPVIVEIYTSIAARTAGLRKGLSKIRDGQMLDTALDNLNSQAHAPLHRYDDHSTDAIITTAWLRSGWKNCDFWEPTAMTPHIARTEGWTFGVT